MTAIATANATGGSQRFLRQVTAMQTAAAKHAPQVVHVLPIFVSRFITCAHDDTRCVRVQLKMGLSIAGPACTTSVPSAAITP